MKRIVVLSALCMAMAGNTAMAQKYYNVSIGEINCTVEASEKTEKQVAGEVVGTILGAAIGGRPHADAPVNHPEKAESAISAVRAGISNVKAFNIVTTDPYYTFTGTVTELYAVPEVSYHKQKMPGEVTINVPVRDYRAKMAVSLTRTNMNTGSKASNTYTYKSDLFRNEDDAVNSVIMQMARYITKCLNEDFPVIFRVSGKVLSAVKSSKKAVTEVYVDHESRSLPAIYLEVMRVENVGGHEIRKSIGYVEVIENVSSEVSLCKVKKGKKEIKEALDKGFELVISGSYR